MPLPQNDAEVERLVVQSALVRAARAALVALDRVTARSAVVAFALQPWPVRTIVGVVLIASLVHAAIVTFVPAESAPPGRYLLAAIGLLSAAALSVAAGRRSDRPRS